MKKLAALVLASIFLLSLSLLLPFKEQFLSLGGLDPGHPLAYRQFVAGPFVPNEAHRIPFKSSASFRREKHDTLHETRLDPEDEVVYYADWITSKQRPTDRPQDGYWPRGSLEPDVY